MRKGIIHKYILDENPLMHIERLEKAFFQISSAIIAGGDSNRILELLVREALSCLMAHRCTLFLVDEKRGMLTSGLSVSSDRSYEQVGLKEEEEVTQKILSQNLPFLLGNSKAFPKFSKGGQKGGKVTSFMGVPLFSKAQGKNIGVLSAVLINEEKNGFDEKRLQFFSSFANFILITLENANRLEELQKKKVFIKTYERYIDQILYRLQLKSSSEETLQELESPGEKLGVQEREEEKEIPKYQKEEEGTWVHGTITSKELSGVNLRQHERVETILRVEFGNEDLIFTKNLSEGGAFIQTTDPLELGDQFLLKLYLPDDGEPIEVESKVIWTNRYRASKNSRKGMGVKFLNLQPEKQERIQKYIKSLKIAALE